MSAAALILRMIVATILILTLGVIAVFGFFILEPFQTNFGKPPAGLGWGDPGGTALIFASFGFIGLLLVVVIWYVYAPIREDKRQQIRY